MKVLPGRDIDIWNCVEVFEQVISLNVGSSQRWTQESQPQVGEGEEVSQILHDLHSGVQGVHIDQLWTCEHSKASTHLEHNSFLFLLAKHIDQVSYSCFRDASMIHQRSHGHLVMKWDWIHVPQYEGSAYLCPNPARVLLGTDDPG